MNYEQALHYIHSCKTFGSRKNGLDNMVALMRALGNPQRAFPVVHVAGTNGKGSTSAMIASVLRTAGKKTALYTSPFLERYNERMQIGGAPIPDESLARITACVVEAIRQLTAQGMDHPTEFEMGTAIALTWFAEQQVDVAVIEVGIGGRLDPTNIVNGDVCVITAIGMDHTAILGDTLDKIASEKSGIIKSGSKVALYPQGDEVRNRVRAASLDKQSELLDLAQAEILPHPPGLYGQRFDLSISGHQWKDLSVPLLGIHQAYNAATAIGALILLDDLHPDWGLIPNIPNGLAQTRWPGRLELVHRQPLVLLDGAHNEHGARALSQSLQTLLPGRRIHLVTGILHGKDAEGIARDLAKHVKTVYATRPDSPRARDPKEVQALFSSQGVLGECYPNAKDAVQAAMAACGPEEAMLIAGSLYLVGEVRPLFHN